MKLHSPAAKTVLFLLILIVFILPPLFVTTPSSGAFSEWRFPLRMCLYAACAGALLFFQGIPRRDNTPARKIRFFYNSGWSLMTFGALCTAAAVVELIFYQRYHHQTEQIGMPSNVTAYVWCILNFLCSSFYEEVMYRFYLPETALSLIPAQKDQLPIKYGIEAAAVILFSLSHRYLGLPAVINSAACGILLRICYKKTHSIGAVTSAHFFYNSMTLYLFSKF